MANASAATTTTVLFDLDGTLIDTAELILLSFEYTLERLLPSLPRTRDTIRAYLGDPLAVTFERLAPGNSELVAQLLTTYREFNHARHDSLIRRIPNMLEALTLLQHAGFKMAIVTSKSTSLAEHGLDVCGLRGFFPVVVGVDACAEHKPKAGPALEALKRLGVTGGKVFFVGDAPADILCGRAAKCDATIAVEWTALERSTVEATAPTHWVRDAPTLAQLLLELGK